MNAYLKRLQDAIQSATRGMTADDLSRRPAKGKWSTAEVLEHLSLTYSGTMKNLSRSLDAGKPLGGTPTVKQRLIDLLILDIGYFPPGRTSPEAAKPQGIPCERLLAEINTQLSEMDDVIQTCESKFGKRAMVSNHPILGPFTMQQWRKFHWAHGRHHIKQIAAMRRTSAGQEKAP